MSVGIPGSGKTTLLKPFAEARGLIYINRDDIRQELLGDATDQSANKKVWEEANKRTAQALAEGHDVVLDATFLESKKRTDMVSFVRTAGATRIIALIWNIPFQVSMDRNLSRERTVKKDVMLWMKEKLETEPPTLSEGFDKIYALEEFDALATEF